MSNPVTIIQKILRRATPQTVEFITFSGRTRSPPIETGRVLSDILSPLSLSFET